MSHVPARSARLYNTELAPESATSTWRTHNLFNWWMAGWRAIAALAVGGFISLLLTFVPAWSDAVPFAWPAGIVVGGLTYAILNSRSPSPVLPATTAATPRTNPPAEAPVSAR